MDESMFRTKGAVIGLVVIGLYVLVLAVTQAPSEPEGRSGSSFSTSPLGLAAYRTLADESGYATTQRRVPLSRDAPNPGATLVLAGAVELDDEDAAAFRLFVIDGGRLVSAGNDLAWLLAEPTTAATRTDEVAAVVAPFQAFAGIETITGSLGLTWQDPGSLLPLYGTRRGIAAGVADIGAGTVIATADATVFANENLASLDNAAFALAALGTSDRPVEFVEYVHGFTDAGGLLGLPGRWQLGLISLFFAGAVFLLARGRRLGPPERAERVLPPPRTQYVDALAAALRKTRDPAGVAHLIQTAIHRSLRRRGVDEVTPETIAATIDAPDLDATALSAALSRGATEEDLVTLGRALAALESKISTRSGR